MQIQLMLILYFLIQLQQMWQIFAGHSEARLQTQYHLRWFHPPAKNHKSAVSSFYGRGAGIAGQPGYRQKEPAGCNTPSGAVLPVYTLPKHIQN